MHVNYLVLFNSVKHEKKNKNEIIKANIIFSIKILYYDCRVIYLSNNSFVLAIYCFITLFAYNSNDVIV